MAITFVAAGATVEALGGNVTPAIPALAQPGDLLILTVGQADNVVSTFPAGWTEVDPTNSGASTRCTWAWRFRVAGDANPLVTHTAGDVIQASIVAYTGVGMVAGLPYTAKSALANASSATVTATGITPTLPDPAIIFWGAGYGTNSANYSGYSGTNPTFTEREDVGTGTGLRGGKFLADGPQTVAAATGTRTATSTRVEPNVGFLIALVNFIPDIKDFSRYPKRPRKQG